MSSKAEKRKAKKAAAAASAAPPAPAAAKSKPFGYVDTPIDPREELLRQPRGKGKVAPEMHALRASIFVSAFSLTAGSLSPWALGYEDSIRLGVLSAACFLIATALLVWRSRGPSGLRLAAPDRSLVWRLVGSAALFVVAQAGCVAIGVMVGLLARLGLAYAAPYADRIGLRVEGVEVGDGTHLPAD